MKEDTQVNTYTDSPCKAFVQHRFKVSHCAHCFKPKSHHPQFFEPITGERISENVRLIEIKSNGERMPARLDSHRKYESRTNKSNGVGTHRSDKLLEDGVLDKKSLAGKTSQLRKQFESQDAPLSPQPINRHMRTSNGAIQPYTPRKKDKPVIMNIPQESSIPLINDLNSNSNHNGAINEHYQSDSDNDILSDSTPPSSRFWRSKWSPKPTRAMDPIPSVLSDVTDLLHAGPDSNVPTLKSMDNSAAPSKFNETEMVGKGVAKTDTEMPNEFQRMVKSLRHIDPPPDSPKVERKAINRYNVGRSTTPGKLEKPQINENSKVTKTVLSTKYSLPSSADSAAVLHNSSALGPSNLSTNHDRKPAETSGRIVNSPENGKDAIQHQGPKLPQLQSSTTSNKSSSETSNLPVATPRRPKQRHRAAYAPVQIPALDLGGKNVKIISRDGSVSYYDGSSKSNSKSPTRKVLGGDTPKSPTKNVGSDSPNGEPLSPTTSAAKAYFVVDISSNPPQGLSTADRRSICGPPLPCTPAPRSRPVSQVSQRSSQSFDSCDSGDEGKLRNKGSRRSLALSDDSSRRSLEHSDDNGIILNRCNSIDSALTESTESDASPVKHMTSGTPESKMLTDGNKRDTPPFPMLLNEKDRAEIPPPSAKSRRDSRDRKRGSGGSHYKVPIFIQPQNYDNLGTAKSDSETKLNELTGKMTPEIENVPEPPIRLTSQDYLEPMMTEPNTSSRNSTELRDKVTSPKTPDSRDSGSFSAASDTEHKSSNAPSQFIAGDNQNQEGNNDEFCSRTRSHPCEPVYAKISHEGRKTSVPSKQKRAAPAPPESVDNQHLYADTLPRSPPPPPPVPSKGKSVSCDSLVVDIPKLTPRRQENNVYSQPPHRKQPIEFPNNQTPVLRPRPFDNSGEGAIRNKSQAPIPSPRKVHTEIYRNASTDSPYKASGESNRKILAEPSRIPADYSKKTSVKISRDESPIKSSSAEVIYQTPSELPQTTSEDSSSHIIGDTPLAMSPPRRNFQSVRVPTTGKVLTSQSPAPIWTKEGSPTKGKAPVPSQIRNARHIAPSPVKNPPQNYAPNRTANSQRTNSPIERVELVRNGSASPVLQRLTDTPTKTVANNITNRSPAPSPPLGRVAETRSKIAANTVTSRSAPSPPLGKAAETSGIAVVNTVTSRSAPSPPLGRAAETSGIAVVNTVTSRSAPSPPLGRSAEGQAKTVPDGNPNDTTPARTIPPLPPNSPRLRRPGQLPQVPDDTITQGPKVENRSKKSKLPWKWRKRGKEDGSPEREFNAEPVQKWLDEIQKMQLEDLTTHRHSLDRLDVINAYKGQPTAIIIPKSNLPAVPQDTDDLDGPVPQPRRNSTVKRQAPRIPSGQGEMDDKADDLPMIQKSYSLSPTSRRKRMGSYDDAEENLYENVGVQRKDGAPPSKPTRRVRNRTTGFEDLPSQKRMAPKVPAEEEDQPSSRKSSLSEQDKPEVSPSPDPATPSSKPDPVAPPRMRIRSDAKETSKTQSDKVARYLKSAMKSSEGSKKFDEDGKPRRPVRIKAPSDENSNNVKKASCIFDNLEYLLTSDIKMDTKASLDSFYGNVDAAKLPNSSTDATVQCSFPSGGSAGSNHGSGMNAVFDTMLQMNSRTLAAVGSAWELPARVPWWSAETKWLEFIGEEPCCQSDDAVFYEGMHRDHADNPVAVMISTRSDFAPQLAKLCSEPIAPHPNLFTIYHATKEKVSTKLIGSKLPGLTMTNHIDQSQELLDSAVVVAMDKVPCMSLSDFVMDNTSFHDLEPEKYESDVALLLLQLCNAIHHLEVHCIALKTVNLEQIVLMQTNLPGSGLKPVLNHSLSELLCSEESNCCVGATAEQIEQRSAEFHLGVMTYRMLHVPSPFAINTNLITQDYSESDLPSIPNLSKYSLCLKRLATQFLAKNSSSRLTARQGVLALQTMLWGPQVDQLPLDTKDPKALEQALQQWLLLEQARVVNKAAEASIQQQQGSAQHANSPLFALKDLLQCQYLSEATVASIKDGLKLLFC